LTTLHYFLPAAPKASADQSRCGNSPRAASRPTTLATPATSTRSPSHPMAPSVRPEAKTEPPCCGTLTRASTSTLSPLVTRSTPSSSPPTATGCAPPPPRASSSSISRRRARSMSSSPSTWRLAKRAGSPSVSPWPGALTARPCSLDIRTTASAAGVSWHGDRLCLV